MKICYFTDHAFSEEGGLFYSGGGIPSSMLFRYVRGNSELLVVGRKASGKNTTLSSIPNSSFYLLNNYSAPQDVIFRYHSLVKELKGILAQCDGVIIRFPSLVSLMAHKMANRLKIPVAVEVCGCAYDSYRYYGNLIGLFAAPISEYLHRKAMRKTKFGLYVTQHYLQELYPAAKDAITVGCSDAVIEMGDAAMLERRMDRIKRLNERIFILGQIGNLEVSYKGYSVALKAISILRDKGINVQYHLVGGGSPSRVLNEADRLGVKDSVVVKGKLPHEKISMFMESLDVYVHPSYLEGLSRSILEAISYATPVLSSDVGGAKELIDNEMLHKAGDARKLASQIELLMLYPDRLIKMAQDNYFNSKQYQTEVLNKRRDMFYDSFFAIV